MMQTVNEEPVAACLEFSDPFATRLQNFIQDCRAVTAVEFALLAPIFLSLLLGVLAMGIYLQNINALQSAANDTARQVTVAYQRDIDLQPDTIVTTATSVATSAPYLLDIDRLEVSVASAATSRVTGATEFNLGFSYQLMNIPLVPMEWMTITYTRPVFVVS